MTGSVRLPIPVLTNISSISSNRKAWLCDVWGVLHDGVSSFAPAIEACQTFRRQGGQVLLISNSPRPSADLLAHLRSLGIGEACFDALITSGDVTRTLVQAYAGQPIFHLGPERDKGFFEGLNINFAPAAKATALVCTGFFDEDHEVAEDYDEMLTAFAARSVPMICANPDLYVERGSRLLPCAGLLAKRYEALGQTVIQAGKPYPPIYGMAFKALSRPARKDEMLAIGDGLDTDIKGAAAQGIDAVYIASRVHIGDADGGESLSPERLDQLFAGRPGRPIAALAKLRW
jgi:HAD superfamily hydrolase (TIGR01459 family)